MRSKKTEGFYQITAKLVGDGVFDVPKKSGRIRWRLIAAPTDIYRIMVGNGLERSVAKTAGASPAVHNVK